MARIYDSSTLTSLSNHFGDAWCGNRKALEDLLRLACWKPKPGAESDWVTFSGAVGRAIAKNSRLSPAALTLLKACGNSDPEPDIRRAALRAIALGWTDDAETLDFLKERAASDSDAEVRAAVLDIIAQCWAGYVEPLDFVRERAVYDPNPNVRLTAFRAICWAVDVEQLGFWENRAETDPAPEVRAAILEELAVHWTRLDIDALDFVRRRALSDTDPNVRRAAEKAIAVTRAGRHKASDGFSNQLPWYDPQI